MWLDVLQQGHNLRNRLALRLMRALSGAEPDDVIKTSMYRPAFFGRPWIHLLRNVMRGDSEWSPGERELFAVFTSRMNTCRYCVGIHLGTTALALDPMITTERLDHWREAAFEPRIMATLELLEKITLSPAQVVHSDIEKVYSAGVSEEAVVDALYVCFLFNVVNRLANALGYDWGTGTDVLKLAKVLHRVGYRLPGFLLR